MILIEEISPLVVKQCAVGLKNIVDGTVIDIVLIDKIYKSAKKAKSC